MSDKARELLSWFEKRKEEVIAGGLSTHVLAVHDCSTDLSAMIQAMVKEDYGTAIKCAERVYLNEKTADTQEDELCKQLSIGDISPSMRSDLLLLVHDIDNIADWCKEAAMTLQIIIEAKISVPVSIWHDFLDISRSLQAEIRQFMNAIRIMESDDFDSINACLRIVMDQERDIDKATYNLTKILWMSDLPERTVSILKNLVDEMEEAADNCKMCADTVRILTVSRA